MNRATEAREGRARPLAVRDEGGAKEWQQLGFCRARPLDERRQKHRYSFKLQLFVKIMVASVKILKLPKTLKNLDFANM